MKKTLLAAFLLISGLAFADGACVNDVAMKKTGAYLSPVAAANVLVCTYTNGTCASPATVYSDGALSMSIVNPVAADADGNYSFCAAPGRYTVQVTNPLSGAVITIKDVTIQPNFNGVTGDGLGGLNLGTLKTSNHIDLTKIPTPANPASTAIRLYADDSTGNLKCKKSDGSDCIQSSSVFLSLKDYGAKCDGTTDDTSAINSAITAAVAANGATIVFPSGTCVALGQIALPYTISGTGKPIQPYIRLTGQGANFANDAAFWGMTPGGTVLDLRYSASTAKILTLGSGRLEIDHITLLDKTDGTLPFLYSTFTSLTVRDSAFVGKTCKSSTNTQDAIVFGGTTTNVSTAASTSGFQGYGTEIRNNHFSCLRGLRLQTYANAIDIVNNTFWNDGGGAAAIYISGNAGVGSASNGGTITGNLFEVNHYVNAIYLQNAQGFTITGNNYYDYGGVTTAVIYLDTNSQYNWINESTLPGTAPLVSDNASVKSNTWFTTYPGVSSHFAGILDFLQVYNNSGGATKLLVQTGSGQSTTPPFIVQSSGGQSLMNIVVGATASQMNVSSPDGSANFDAKCTNASSCVLEAANGSLSVNAGGVQAFIFQPSTTNNYSAKGINVGVGCPTGSASLSVCGGGRAAFAEGLQDTSTAAKPTCDVNKRGLQYVEKGATGVADVRYICMKNAANTYNWVAASTFYVVATHASVDLASVATGACSAATSETITGAALGDECTVASGAATADGSWYVCNVTAANTAKWSYCNLSGGAIDRAVDTYTIRVLR